ncbi:MAG: hypothetical protein Q4D13_04140 [Erysipelotrichaceae bacterium]|nr:hypothetical protein [Erysipelotrichaceae bacterium]
MKKLLMILMSVMMVFALVGCSSSGGSSDTPAEDAVLYVGSTAVSESGDVLGDGTVTYDKDTNTLTLNNATIDAGANKVSVFFSGGSYEEVDGTITYCGEADLNVVLEGDNKLVSGEGTYTAGIVMVQYLADKDQYNFDYAETAALNISGNGSITMDGYSLAGILTAESGDINMDGIKYVLDADTYYGIYGGAFVNAKDSEISVNTAHFGISAGGGYTNDNTVVAMDNTGTGIESSGYGVTVNSGSISVTNSDLGVGGTMVTMNAGTIVVSDCTTGIAGEFITFNGGYTDINNPLGAGIYSTSEVFINGGGVDVVSCDIAIETNIIDITGGETTITSNESMAMYCHGILVGFGNDAFNMSGGKLEATAVDYPAICGLTGYNLADTLSVDEPVDGKISAGFVDEAPDTQIFAFTEGSESELTDILVYTSSVDGQVMISITNIGNAARHVMVK